MNLTKVYIENGNLIAEYMEGENMAKVDLGNVVGPQGPAGTNGITPTFSIENGHLYADYDNPYQG